MIEEYKIAVFAPEVGTVGSISAKRLNEILRDIRGKIEAAVPPPAKPGRPAPGTKPRPAPPAQNKGRSDPRSFRGN